jgi:hypothetical protein
MATFQLLDEHTAPGTDIQSRSPERFVLPVRTSAILFVILLLLSGCRQQKSEIDQRIPGSLGLAERKDTSPYRPVRLVLLPNFVEVRQGANVTYKFTIPSGVRNAQFEGDYRIEPSPRARMDIAIVTDAVFGYWRDYPREGTVYHSGLKSADRFTAPVDPGTYHLVLYNNDPADVTNSYWPNPSRSVSGKFYLKYEQKLR